QPGALENDTDPSVLMRTDNTAGVTLADSAALHVDPFTVECWVYLTATGDTTRWRVIAHKEGATGTTRQFFLGLTPDTKFNVHFSFIGPAAGQFNSVSGTRSLGLFRWYHLCFVHRAGVRTELWIDGELDASFVTTATVATDTNPIRVGLDGTSQFDGFPGRI